MTDHDLMAHLYLGACRRDAVAALSEGRHDAATRAIMDRDDFLAGHPEYDDGTYRAKN